MWLLSNKITVRDSGLLEGFCDYHCHLLPGVDDGVEEVKETLRILREWESVGVKKIWLTPHIMEDIPNEPSELRRRFTELQKSYNGSIRLNLAAEHMMDGLFLRRFNDNDNHNDNHNDNLNDNHNDNLNDNHNLNDNGRLVIEDNVMLVETSYYIPPMNMEGIIDSIKAKGYDPLLAHPERYQYMEKDAYRHWKEKGVLLQLNLPSLVGAYGPEVMRKAEWLLRENMYDYCGTDTHSEEQMELFLDGIINKKVVKKVRRITERP